MTPICTRVNAESIGRLLERLDKIGITWAEDDSKASSFEPEHGTFLVYDERGLSWNQYRLKGWRHKNENAFIAAIKEECPR